MGEFVVGVNGRLPLLDPGADVYAQDTFSPRRYEIDMINSRGHSVPVVGGRLQKTGADAAARILKADFTPQQDSLVLDLTAVYDVPSLRHLERAFVYSRLDKGALTVTDRFAFAQPESFESTLITYGTFTQKSPDTLIISDDKKPRVRVCVKIDTGGLPFEVRQTVIKATKLNPPTRIAIALKDKATEGSVSLHITPIDEP